METITVICGVCAVKTDGSRYCPRHGQLDGETYKVINQIRKAQKLAPALIAAGHKPGEEISDTTKRLAERVAGVPASSEQTWAITELLVS